MPIYAYVCDACGHEKDTLQKLSDPVLTTCPECGAEKYRRKLTAAGFQLKGSGWYVTDFRDGGAKKSTAASSTAGASAPAESGSSGGDAAAAPADAAAQAPAPAPAPAAAKSD